MSTKTIKWTCTAQPNWEWLSGGAGNPGIPIGPGGQQITGTITLASNDSYWYPCIGLVLQGVTTGNAMLRFFSQGGVDVVQAMTVAQGEWAEEGNIGSQSVAAGKGGINLVAELQ